MPEGPLGISRPFADSQLVMEIEFENRVAPNSAEIIIEQAARDALPEGVRVDFKEFRDGKYKAVLILPQHISGDNLDRIERGVAKCPAVENQGNTVTGYVVAVE